MGSASSTQPWLLILLNYHPTYFCGSMQHVPVFLSPALQEIVHSIYCFQRALHTTLQFKFGSFLLHSKLIFLTTKKHPSKVKPSLHMPMLQLTEQNMSSCPKALLFLRLPEFWGGEPSFLASQKHHIGSQEDSRENLMEWGQSIPSTRHQP